jgi:hypothetical protein
VVDACECGNEPSGSVKCGGNFLTSCKPVSCSRRTLHRGVSKWNFCPYLQDVGKTASLSRLCLCFVLFFYINAVCLNYFNILF